ncbi:MAG TPA: hypothetical protein VGR18_08495 [Rubrobacter sp.]|nr:hypothetical protein [Rubrobacter sp.]
MGLEIGADGYVTKPLGPRELGFPGLGVDLLRREVMSQGGGVSLTAAAGV